MPIPEDVIKEMFQSTRPHGRTRHSVSGAEFGFPVSIHAYSREDATRRTANPFPCGRFQSTRPRGRTRHERDARGGTRYTVSIHASSREDATLAVCVSVKRSPFQSTRPRGRTRPCSGGKTVGNLDFNPRVLAGGRDFMPAVDVIALVISIPASSREDATMKPLPIIPNEAFQSTRPRGRTRLD